MATKTPKRLTPVTHAIRNEKEFDRAVAELDTLIDADPAEGSAAHDRMELLAILIGAYEEKTLAPFKPASPQEIVRFMSEQKRWTNAKLADLLGGRSRLSDFYHGVRPLSRSQIISLRDALGIPADLLLENEAPSRAKRRTLLSAGSRMLSSTSRQASNTSRRSDP